MMHPMVNRNASAGHNEIGELPGQQRAVRNVIKRIVLGPVAGDRDDVIARMIDLVAPENVAAY